MEPKEHREFTFVEGLAMGLSMLGIQIYSELINQWGQYFYSPELGTGRIVYVAIGFVGAIFILGTVWDGIANPVAGAWSDMVKPTPGRWRIPRINGRRRPFIFWGAVGMLLTFNLFWFPPMTPPTPTPDNSHAVQHAILVSQWINLAFGALVLCAHNTLFALVSVPLLALGPEIARSNAARVKLGTFCAIGMIFGLALANALPGEIITRMGEPGDPWAYRKTAAIFSVIATAALLLPVLLIRERFDGKTEHIATKFWQGFRDALANRPFVIYTVAYFFFTAGFLAVQRVLPYWVSVGLGKDEDAVTMLLLPFLVTALISAPLVNIVCKYLHIKWVTFIAFMIITTGLPTMYFIGAADLPSDTKFLLGAMLFAYTGIGQGIMYVVQQPMIGEIIDYDEKLFGQRREALFNGLANICWKFSMAVSILVATQSMNWLGNSTASPLGIYIVGPIAGIFGLVGALIVIAYPVMHVTREENARD